jgi:hypothetical protein
VRGAEQRRVPPPVACHSTRTVGSGNAIPKQVKTMCQTLGQRHLRPRRGEVLRRVGQHVHSVTQSPLPSRREQDGPRPRRPQRATGPRPLTPCRRSRRAEQLRAGVEVVRGEVVEEVLAPPDELGEVPGVPLVDGNVTPSEPAAHTNRANRSSEPLTHRPPLAEAPRGYDRVAGDGCEKWPHALTGAFPARPGGSMTVRESREESTRKAARRPTAGRPGARHTASSSSRRAGSSGRTTIPSMPR